MTTDEIETALRKMGLRVTPARRGVFECLCRSSEPMAAAELRSAMLSIHMPTDLVTIYRTLETLERHHLIVRVDRLNEGWRYTIQSAAHHHSITCSACGSVAPLDVCELDRLERALERQTGFTNVRHSLQFYGTCPKCRQ